MTDFLHCIASLLISQNFHASVAGRFSQFQIEILEIPPHTCTRLDRLQVPPQTKHMITSPGKKKLWPSLERNEPRGVGGADTGPSVLDGPVGVGELAEVVAGHLRLDLNLDEEFPIVH